MNHWIAFDHSEKFELLSSDVIEFHRRIVQHNWSVELIDPSMLFGGGFAVVIGFVLGGMWARYKDPSAVEARAIKAAMEALKSLEKPEADPVSVARELAARNAQITAIKAEAAKLV